MTTETLTKQNQLAIEHFERKLAFEIGPIGLKYALEAKEPVTVVDLRTPEIYAKGHIPGSVNISIEELERDRSALSKDKTTIVLCYNITCHLATKAALLLAKKGYPVKELVGGFNDYQAANLPVEGKKEHSSCGSSSCS